VTHQWVATHWLGSTGLGLALRLVLGLRLRLGLGFIFYVYFVSAKPVAAILAAK